jgi:hypothetical protein
MSVAMNFRSHLQMTKLIERASEPSTPALRILMAKDYGQFLHLVLVMAKQKLSKLTTL